MTTKATPNRHETTREATLFVALELREKTWKLGFTIGHGHKPRERSVPARNQERILHEIVQARRLSEKQSVDLIGLEWCRGRWQAIRPPLLLKVSIASSTEE